MADGSKHSAKVPALICLGVCLLLLGAVVTLLCLPGGEPDGGGETVLSPEQTAPADGDGGGEDDGSSAPASGSHTASGGDPVVKEQAEIMGPAYYADAAFLGNVITSGLWLYNNDGLLPADTSHWYCADKLTVQGASPYAAQMPAETFGKVYIGFGMYEVNYQKETLRAAFSAIIDQVRASQPDAIIYLMSVTPVSKYCDENLQYTRNAVISFNSMLQDIAREEQVWYLDVYPVLCGEDGYLPSNVTPDGITFNPDHYQKWFDYLRTHYVPDGTPPVALQTPEPTAETDGG